MTLKERLLNKLIETTKTIKSKRQCEWQLHRCCETVLTIITVLAVVSVVSLKGWLLVLSLLIWGLVLYGWNRLSSSAMEMMLNILYPKGETDEEIQENQLNQLFQNIDTLIKQLNED